MSGTNMQYIYSIRHDKSGLNARRTYCDQNAMRPNLESECCDLILARCSALLKMKKKFTERSSNLAQGQEMLKKTVVNKSSLSKRVFFLDSLKMNPIVEKRKE